MFFQFIRMEVEPVSCIKQRGNRSTIPPPVTDDREDENDEVPITQDQEAPKAGLLWRAGSGLWGITSVGSFNKFFLIILSSCFYLAKNLDRCRRNRWHSRFCGKNRGRRSCRWRRRRGLNRLVRNKSCRYNGGRSSRSDNGRCCWRCL